MTAASKTTLGRGLLVAFLVLIRVWRLTDDPPPWLSWSSGLYTDEGFYTLDARHRVLFNSPAPGNFHDRLLSPLMSLLQEVVFRIFGAGLISARAIDIAFGVATIVVLWIGVRRTSGEQAGGIAALFLGIAPPFLFYNRMALQETPTVFWMTLAFCLWACGYASSTRRMEWWFGAGAAAGLAIVFKGLAIILLPAFVAAFAAAMRGYDVRAIVEPIRRREIAVCAGGLLLVVAMYGGCWVLPHHADLARMGAYYARDQFMPHTWRSLGLNVERGLWGGNRSVVLYLLATMNGAALIACLQRRWRAPADAFLVTWLLTGLLFCLVSSYAPSRYYVLFLPALAALAGVSMARAMTAPSRFGIAVKLRNTYIGSARLSVSLLSSMALGCCFVLAGSYLIVENAIVSDHTLMREGAQLTNLTPPGALAIGDMAPSLALNTDLRAAPVQPGLSNSDHPVEILHPALVLVTRSPVYEHWWISRYPKIVRPENKVKTLEVGRLTADVYQVPAGKTH